VQRALLRAEGLESEEAGLRVHQHGGLDRPERDVLRTGGDGPEPVFPAAEVRHRGLDLRGAPLPDLAKRGVVLGGRVSFRHLQVVRDLVLRPRRAGLRDHEQPEEHQGRASFDPAMVP
jgi:hypothetical protein